MLAPMLDAIPAELREVPRWVVWRGAKVPYRADCVNSTASVTDPATWSPFEAAATAYGEGGWSGVGLVLAGDGLVGIDLDKCVTSGRPRREALALLKRIGAGYVELSPSGTGLRAFGRACGAPTGRRGKIDGINVELYSDRRYLTVTGRAIQNGPIAELPGFLAAVDSLTPTEEEQKTTEDDRSSLQSSSGLFCRSLPPNVIPGMAGERNRCLFALARWAKGVHPDATTAQLRTLVQEWHRLALPHIGTADFTTSWTDFMRGLAAVKSPYGLTLEKLMERLDEKQLPDGIDGLAYGEAGNRLVCICQALAVHNAPAPFFLSSRQAGELLGVHFTDASKMLAALVLDGVLHLESRGVGRVASRYRYAWGSR
jgi:hypothetical protein